MPLKDRRPSSSGGHKISLFDVLMGIYGSDVAPNPDVATMSNAEAASMREQGFTLPENLHTYENTPAFVGKNIFAKPRAAELSNALTSSRIEGHQATDEDVRRAWALVKPHLAQKAGELDLTTKQQKEIDDYMLSGGRTEKMVAQDTALGKNKNELESERDIQKAKNELTAKETAIRTLADPTLIQDANAPALALKEGEAKISDLSKEKQTQTEAAANKFLTRDELFADPTMTGLRVKAARAGFGMTPDLLAQKSSDKFLTTKSGKIFDPNTGEIVYAPEAMGLSGKLTPEYLRKPKGNVIIRDSDGAQVDRETGEVIQAPVAGPAYSITKPAPIENPAVPVAKPSSLFNSYGVPDISKLRLGMSGFGTPQLSVKPREFTPDYKMDYGDSFVPLPSDAPYDPTKETVQQYIQRKRKPYGLSIGQ